MNLVFSGGNSSLEEMIASTDRGLLVTRLWYIREVDPYEKIMTGMTRDGLFLVEKGKVAGAVRNFRFNQSLLEMLRNVELTRPRRARHRRRSLRNGRPGDESSRLPFLRSHQVLIAQFRYRTFTKSLPAIPRRKPIRRIQILSFTCSAPQALYTDMSSGRRSYQDSRGYSCLRAPIWLPAGAILTGAIPITTPAVPVLSRALADPPVTTLFSTPLPRWSGLPTVVAWMPTAPAAMARACSLRLPVEFFPRARQRAGHRALRNLRPGFRFSRCAPRLRDARSAIEHAAESERLRILGWRRVPVNVNSLGRRALRDHAGNLAVFCRAAHATKTPARFERRLAMLRKRAEVAMPPRCYICSLSSRTVVYKGLLTPWQFPQFYEDLRDHCFRHHLRNFSSALLDQHPAVLGSRAAVPPRRPQRGNQHHHLQPPLAARQTTRTARGSEGWRSGFRDSEPNVSDSASFDNAFELKLLEGFSAEEAMLSLVPPAFEKDPHLSRDVRAALTAVSQQGEPWDGPAALVFSDGHFRWRETRSQRPASAALHAHA